MLSKVLSTPVDDLVVLVKTNNNCSINFLKTKLNVPSEVLEKWLVVLEEYNVLRVRYNGFEGFVTMSQETKLEKKKNKINVEKIKEVFIEKAKSKNLNYEKMKQIWPLFVKKYETDIKDLFEDSAKNIGYETPKIDKAWVKYRMELNDL